MVWVAATRLISPTAGLFALAATALHPFHLAYSQEARAYTMLFALSAASMWTLAEWLQSRKPEWAAAYVAVTIALLYTHYWGVFVWLGGVVLAAITSWRVLAPPAVAMAAFLPHIPALVRLAAANRDPVFWTPAPSLANLGDAAVVFTGTRFFIGGWLFTLGGGVLWGILLFAALWTAGIVAPGAVRTWLAAMLASALLLPFVLSYVLPQAFISFRYTMAVFPAAVWLAAWGWSRLERVLRVATAAALLVLLAAGCVNYFAIYRKGNMKDAAEFVRPYTYPGAVVIVPEYMRFQWQRYGRSPVILEAGIDEMAPKFAGNRQVVFVTLDVPNPVKDAMDSRYRRIAERRFPAAFHLGLVVAVYRLK